MKFNLYSIKIAKSEIANYLHPDLAIKVLFGLSYLDKI